MELLIQSLFWISAALLLYTYAGYPVLVFLISFFFPKKHFKREIEPAVTILITAYNESKAIREKLENTLRIDYPKERLEILVASDGSNDETDDIVREFSSRGVKLFHQPGRKGKTYTQNEAVRIAEGEIILFSDATTAYGEEVLKKVIPNFADRSIGCVAGRLEYFDETNSGIGQGAQRYWSYESFIKECESRASSLVGASGCLYAVRKSAYRPMYPEACSDFLICSIVYQQGLRSIYEPEAVCIEETNRNIDQELKMRVRVIAQTYTDLWRNRGMMNPLKSGFFAVELISHKFLRYSVPIFLFAAFISSGLSVSDPLMAIVFLLQVAFYTSAILGWGLERFGKGAGPLIIPVYFILANLAAVIGFYKFATGERFQNWEPIRDTDRDSKRLDSLSNQTNTER